MALAHQHITSIIALLGVLVAVLLVLLAPRPTHEHINRSPQALTGDMHSGTDACGYPIEFLFCTYCLKKWAVSSQGKGGLGRATAVANMHVRGRKGRLVSDPICPQGIIKAHYYKPSNSRVGGFGVSHEVALPRQKSCAVQHDDSNADCPDDPFEPISEYTHHDTSSVQVPDNGRIHPDLAQELATFQAPNVNQRPVVADNHPSWNAKDIMSIMNFVRRGNSLESSTTLASRQQEDKYNKLILSPSTSDTSKYTRVYWTLDQLNDAMNCPADVTCFGASRDTGLREFQTNMQTTRTEERFMAFCHEENLTLATTRKLYTFLKEEEFDHSELTHSDYCKLHRSLQSNIPDEYSFTMVPVTANCCWIGAV
jgi:hypothetical protein